MSEELTGQQHAFWTTYVMEVGNPDHARIRQPLKDLFHRLEDEAADPIASGIAPEAKRGLFESRFDVLDLQRPAIRELRGFIEEALDSALAFFSASGRKEAEYEIHEAWAHITRDGGAHDHHCHPDSFWCGIYYVDIGDCDLATRNGVNRFYSPVPEYFDPATGNRLSAYEIEPRDGLLTLFPGYLYHSALPYRGERERHVVAFNSRLLSPRR